MDDGIIDSAWARCQGSMICFIDTAGCRGDGIKILNHSVRNQDLIKREAVEIFS
jgi:hypothetical protein